MLYHPEFDPIAVHIGPIAVRWYGLMYLIGFASGLMLGRARIRANQNPSISIREFDDLLFYIILGVIVGGRLGYALIYDLAGVLHSPISILYVWKGGMSFHGGLIGVCVAVALYARFKQKDWLVLTDFVAPLVPLGLAAGRIGNFINGELWGRATDVPWAIIFPQSGTLTGRHPSQLYEFFLEGIVLFTILWFFSRTKRPIGATSGLFLVGYALFRFVVEFMREPDAHLGLLSFGFSMGQWLCIPMLLLGVFLMFRAGQKQQMI
ncbi:MAG: prolipoprotein diacylglyceryl transferase [Burkholderiales bacterium]|jgi:phosphatidylglycerol:prolipoprotein diacylglycerol transferase|tara:strand:- start:30571 stop:31362 length:792 start_codon:yes stop_codon:yes gene_type:complete